MEIEATNPITINTTFDKFWLTNLLIIANDPNKAVSINASLVPYATDEYNVGTVDRSNPVRVNIRDLYAVATERAAAGKPAMANAIEGLLSALSEYAKDKGLI